MQNINNNNNNNNNNNGKNNNGNNRFGLGDPNEQTLILQDENGQELQRIVSSRDPRMPLINQIPTNAFQANGPMMMPPYGLPQPPPMTPMVPPMTPLMYQQQPPPPPYYLTQPVVNSVIATPGALSNQIIFEEDENEFITNGTDVFRKVSSRAIVTPYPDPKLKEIDQLRKIRRKQDDYIYCCSFCEAPTNDTCYFCWRILAMPAWLVALLIAVGGLVIVGLAIVIALFATKVIKV